jgi:hypothetical protein
MQDVIPKLTKAKRAGGMALVREYLPSKCKSLFKCQCCQKRKEMFRKHDQEPEEKCKLYFSFKDHNLTVQPLGKERSQCERLLERVVDTGSQGRKRLWKASESSYAQSRRTVGPLR